MIRKRYIEKIQDALGDQKLIWVGTRGQDAVGLMDIAQFSQVYAIVAPLGALSLEVDLALEDISGRRVDLDTYTVDEDWSPSAREFRHRLLASLNEPVFIVAYRPLALLSAICFPRSEYVTYLGMFHERQATFEHKPWVETELRRVGIPVIPWRYFADEDLHRLEEELIAQGVLVLRANRSDGGAGLGAVRCLDEIEDHMPRSHDGFLAGAPLLDPHTPLNLNACVFPTGEITLHAASIQLIGINECTNRQFGYCGNDYAAIRDLDPPLLDHLEELAKQIGTWLHSHGFIGAFGIDALIYRDEVYISEINPRFQGSSCLAARIDREMGIPDIYLCHIAAMLGLPPPARPKASLAEQVREQPEYAQVILHNLEPSTVQLSEPLAESPGFELQIVPPPEILVEPNAILLRATVNHRVTTDGRSLDSPILISLVPRSRCQSQDDRIALEQ